MFKHFIPFLFLVLVIGVSGVALHKKNNTITNLETKIETQDKTYSEKIDSLEATSSEKIASLEATIAELQTTIVEQQEAINNMTSDLNSDLNPAFIDGSITTLTAEDFEGVTEIRPYAFYGCESLTSVTIPNTVNIIGEHAFDHCSSLTSVNVNATYIRDYAFANTGNITSLSLGTNVGYIGTNAFYYALCSQERSVSVTIPAGVGTVDNGAFSYSTIKNVFFEGCPATVSSDAFDDSFNLEQIIVPDEYYDYYVNKFSSAYNSNSSLSISNLSEIVVKRSYYEASKPVSGDYIFEDSSSSSDSNPFDSSSNSSSSSYDSSSNSSSSSYDSSSSSSSYESSAISSWPNYNYV